VNLDTVSTTCGSGWVNDPYRANRVRLTHPLPQVVLTVSNYVSNVYRQSQHQPTNSRDDK
jgi:hypothetical protein